MEQKARDCRNKDMPGKGTVARASVWSHFPVFGTRRAEMEALKATLAIRGEALSDARQMLEAYSDRLAELAETGRRQVEIQAASHAALEALEQRVEALARAREETAGQLASVEASNGSLSAERDAALERVRALEAALMQAERERTDLHQGWRLIADAADVILWDCDMPSMRLTLSDSFYRMLGYDRATDAITWEIWRGLVHPDDRAMANRQYREHLLGRNERYEAEYRLRRKDGEYRWFSASGKIAFGPDESAQRYAGVLSDISDRKHQEAIIATLAYFDNLTGLPNRTHLLSVLEARLAAGDAGGALLLLDLDNFKTVNDAFGHAFGDRLLQTVAARLQHLCESEALRDAQEGAVVTRFGGDEFMVVLGRGPDRPQPYEVADRMLQILRDPVCLDGRSVYLGGSIGLTMFPEDGTRADLLLKNADTALFRAKAAGRKCRVAYDADMGVEAAVRMEMEEALRGAIRGGELALVFQPQVELATRRITGYEALLRWKSRKYGNVPPDRFIPMAEECGVIHEIGQWVIREACRFAASIPAARRGGLCISVNVSPLQFVEDGLAEQIRAAARVCGIPLSMLAVEITETMLMENFGVIVGGLQSLRADGCHMYLDDFGTGYSSLNYLKNLPIDVLKIDKSFVQDVMVHPTERKLLRAIIGMAHSLRLKVVAEGVETEEQRTFLLQARCNFMQGYLFSRPLPQEEARALLGDE